MRYRVLLFDLFGTVVLFKPKVPTLQVAGGAWRSTMQWLRDRLADDFPDIVFDDFLDAMTAVTQDIARRRPPEYLEVVSAERFRRVLERLGVDGARGADAAERLSLTHMHHLAASTELPETHATLLRELAGEYPLGLISNFDHGPTAHDILARHGIAPLFVATVISADVGRRKPHPQIFAETLAAVRCRREEALFVGDTLADDVCGAQAAGIDVAWISPDGAVPPPDAPPPTYVIRRLVDLPAILSQTG